MRLKTPKTQANPTTSFARRLRLLFIARPLPEASRAHWYAALSGAEDFPSERVVRARGPLSEWKDAQEPSRAADCGPRRDRPRRAETVPGRSRALGREGSNPDQVVRGEGKCKHPVHAAGAPVPRLAHQPDGFEPAEDLLHALAPLLADRVARMPSGSIVNRAAAALAGVLGDMGGHSEQAHRRDEIARVIALVGPEGEAPVAIQRPEQFERGGPFGVAAGGEHAAADRQAVAGFHQHVAGVEELGFLPFAFARG